MGPAGRPGGPPRLFESFMRARHLAAAAPAPHIPGSVIAGRSHACSVSSQEGGFRAHFHLASHSRCLPRGPGRTRRRHGADPGRLLGHALAPDRAYAGRPRPRGGRRCQRAQCGLHRLRQRRRLALHRLRLDLGTDLRPGIHRVHRRHRRRPVRPQRHLRGHRSRHHPARPRHRRRRVQVHRCRPHLDAPRAAEQPDDREHRRRPQEPGPPVRRRARPPLRTQRRARHLSLHRRRQDFPEGVVQG